MGKKKSAELRSECDSSEQSSGGPADVRDVPSGKWSGSISLSLMNHCPSEEYWGRWFIAYVHKDKGVRRSFEFGDDEEYVAIQFGGDEPLTGKGRIPSGEDELDSDTYERYCKYVSQFYTHFLGPIPAMSDIICLRGKGRRGVPSGKRVPNGNRRGDVARK